MSVSRTYTERLAKTLHQLCSVSVGTDILFIPKLSRLGHHQSHTTISFSSSQSKSKTLSGALKTLQFVCPFPIFCIMCFSSLHITKFPRGGFNRISDMAVQGQPIQETCVEEASPSLCCCWRWLTSVWLLSAPFCSCRNCWKGPSGAEDRKERKQLGVSFDHRVDFTSLACDLFALHTQKRARFNLLFYELCKWIRMIDVGVISQAPSDSLLPFMDKQFAWNQKRCFW